MIGKTDANTLRAGAPRIAPGWTLVDGSFLPSSCAVNPALTIMANALRVGDHVRERLG